MKRKYICEKCGGEFDSENECRSHEAACELSSRIMGHMAKANVFSVQESDTVRDVLNWLFNTDMISDWRVGQELDRLDVQAMAIPVGFPNPETETIPADAPCPF